MNSVFLYICIFHQYINLIYPCVQFSNKFLRNAGYNFMLNIRWIVCIMSMLILHVCVMYVYTLMKICVYNMHTSRQLNQFNINTCIYFKEFIFYLIFSLKFLNAMTAWNRETSIDASRKKNTVYFLPDPGAQGQPLASWDERKYFREHLHHQLNEQIRRYALTQCRAII